VELAPRLVRTFDAGEEEEEEEEEEFRGQIDRWCPLEPEPGCPSKPCESPRRIDDPLMVHYDPFRMRNEDRQHWMTNQLDDQKLGIASSTASSKARFLAQNIKE
jgi:hypothetical protein